MHITHCIYNRPDSIQRRQYDIVVNVKILSMYLSRSEAIGIQQLETTDKIRWIISIQLKKKKKMKCKMVMLWFFFAGNQCNALRTKIHTEIKNGK